MQSQECGSVVGGYKEGAQASSLGAAIDTESWVLDVDVQLGGEELGEGPVGEVQHVARTPNEVHEPTDGGEVIGPERTQMCYPPARLRARQVAEQLGPPLQAWFVKGIEAGGHVRRGNPRLVVQLEPGLKKTELPGASLIEAYWVSR